MTDDAIDQNIMKLRAAASLRDALFDELDRMRAGKTNTTDAKQLAKYAAALKKKYVEENETADQ